MEAQADAGGRTAQAELAQAEPVIAGADVALVAHQRGKGDTRLIP